LVWSNSNTEKLIGHIVLSGVVHGKFLHVPGILLTIFDAAMLVIAGG
jgi:hypothetical protein